jgi:hypothetical protein
MGVDTHALNFLRYASNKKPFGATLTIGRQSLFVSEAIARAVTNAMPEYEHKDYCEDLLLGYFGASTVDSVDHSAYENASHSHDMNVPAPQPLVGQFDTIFDGGCLEHIFNVPQALKNCSAFCKADAQIIHVLPANNFCGHGFWQFSPELFFSLYSKANGYSDTEVFLADLMNASIWYRVKQPANGKRVDVASSNPLYVLVRTVRAGKEFSHANVQQSDYVYEWANMNRSHAAVPVANRGIRQWLKKLPFVYQMLSPLYHWYLRCNRGNGLNRANSGLQLVRVHELIR